MVRADCRRTARFCSPLSCASVLTALHYPRVPTIREGCKPASLACARNLRWHQSCQPFCWPRQRSESRVSRSPTVSFLPSMDTG